MGMDGGEREGGKKLNGESETKREKEADIHLSIHQRGDTALQIC